MAFLGCLFKFGMGFIYADANTRQGMATAAMAYKQSFDFDAPPGTGPNSITGLCNAMGSRLFSNTTSLVAGHDFLNESHRRKISDILEIPYENITDRTSLAYDEILDAWGCGSLFRKWTHPEAVFNLLKKLSAGQPCDITGIEGYRHVDEMGAIQWPYPAANPQIQQERRLFSDCSYYTPDKKARILFSPPADLPKAPDADFPFFLITGLGTSSQWHTQSRTAKSHVLRKLYPENPYVEINPEDADRLGLTENSPVRIISRRGEVTVSAYLAPTVQPGQIFLPMHYPELNRFTHPAFDPHSRQTNY